MLDTLKCQSQLSSRTQLSKILFAIILFLSDVLLFQAAKYFVRPTMLDDATEQNFPLLASVRFEKIIASCVSRRGPDRVRGQKYV